MGLLSLGALAAGGFGALMLFLHLYGQRDRAVSCDVIVVLGAQVNQAGVAGTTLRNRTLHAVELYRRGYATAILCTGAVMKHAPSEAAAAAEVARQQGVPSHALILEERSTSTWENVVETASICRERGWSRVMLVSDPYHLWRARRHCRRNGLEAVTSPTGPCGTGKERIKRLNGAAREAYCVCRDWVLGR